jgi:hypothetical protein
MSYGRNLSSWHLADIVVVSVGVCFPEEQRTSKGRCLRSAVVTHNGHPARMGNLRSSNVLCPELELLSDTVQTPTSF